MQPALDEITARLKRVSEAAAEEDARRSSLPCAPALQSGDDAAAARACDAVAAHRACEFATVRHYCPRLRIAEDGNVVARRLQRAGVERRELELVTSGQLLDTDAMIAVRAILERKPRLVTFTSSDAVRLRGDEVLIAMLGPRGVGKSLSGCYALGRMGGAYRTAYKFSRPGLDLEELKREPLVVLDQLGRENIGASDYVLSQIEELLDARYAARRLTLLIGNITRVQFIERYGAIVADRFAGDGAFITFGGSSLRGTR